MRIGQRRWLVFLMSYAFLWPDGAWATKASFLASFQQPILDGIDALLNGEPDKAEATFKALEQRDATGAIIPLLMGYVQLARAEEKEDPDEDLDAYTEQMASTIKRAEAALDKSPRDPDLLLLTGMAWGSKALADGVRKHYIAAYRGLKRCYQLLEEALEVDPEQYDAYYSLGLYHYAFSRLPSVYRTLASILLPSGDRERGLNELHLAAEKGIFTKMLAKLALLRIYTSPEDGYERALPLAQELLARYPGNPELYFHLALIHSELGRFQEALEVAERIAKNIGRGENNFTGVMLPRYYQLMGKLYMDHGDYPTALAFFKKTIESGNKRYAWAVAWAWTRTGMIYDLLGKRAEATEHYKAALKVDGESLAKEYAERYLDEPYQGRGSKSGRRG